MSATFKPEEISIILKWARAYTEEAELLSRKKLGLDMLEPDELELLELRLHHASAQMVMGALNASMLMGFKNMEARYPLQEMWEATRLDKMYDLLPIGPRRDACLMLRGFLEETGLIEKPDPDPNFGERKS
jgi:hypothetical protein